MSSSTLTGDQVAFTAAPTRNGAWARFSKMVLGTIFVLFLLGNAFTAAFIISKYRQIYQDALGTDHPLPNLTAFLLTAQPLMIGLAVLWLVLGLVALAVPKKLSTSLRVYSALVIVTLLQLAITTIALYMPFVTIITGMNSQ